MGRGRCRLHGGSTRSQTKRAESEQVEERARAVLARLGVTPVDNPLEELQRLAGRVLAWERAIGQMVNQLESVRYETEFGERLRAEVALFERAMDRCLHVLVAMARLNLDERLTRVTEAQVTQVFRAVLGGLDDIGLVPEVQSAACSAIARRLRLDAAEEAERERRELPAGSQQSPRGPSPDAT